MLGTFLVFNFENVLVQTSSTSYRLETLLSDKTTYRFIRDATENFRIRFRKSA